MISLNYQTQKEPITLVNNQDFETYADFKQFNANIADTWDMAMTAAIGLIDQPIDTISLLDFGCGDGKYFKHLLGRGLIKNNIHGLEVSAKRVERCHQLGWDNARFLAPTIPLPYKEGMFDLVNCMEVVEHIPVAEGRQVINELRRVLRPGGVLLISTPNYPIKRFYDFCDAALHGKWARLRDDPTHVTYFNHSRLAQLLAPNFTRIEPWPFKPGFLYKRLPKPFFLHKLFFLCQA